MHFVYIVRCADGTLYTGYARDPHARERLHNRGRGARYTAGRRPVSLVYWEQFDSIGDALRRERQLKRLRRARKEALLNRVIGSSGNRIVKSVNRFLDDPIIPSPNRTVTRPSRRRLIPASAARPPA